MQASLKIGLEIARYIAWLRCEIRKVASPFRWFGSVLSCVLARRAIFVPCMHAVQYSVVGLRIS